MSKIRAYKLAEELGMDRAEFVEKAAAAGVELRSAMASLEARIGDSDQLLHKVKQNVFFVSPALAEGD